MSMIGLLIPLSLILVVVAVWAFVWAVNAGQFDDLDTPAWDMLNDEAPSSSSNTSASKNNEINE
ncbi:MAG TPA: cbb3-type cytochrome oxidase assembly protein CcoS [Steroidobacteraceae bacterium]|nr:cbb3-type cytochrome oxidase assembly protein CcoS [Steroidobacteraceae bacterium]